MYIGLSDDKPIMSYHMVMHIFIQSLKRKVSLNLHSQSSPSRTKPFHSIFNRILSIHIGVCFFKNSGINKCPSKVKILAAPECSSTENES